MVGHAGQSLETFNKLHLAAQPLFYTACCARKIGGLIPNIPSSPADTYIPAYEHGVPLLIFSSDGSIISLILETYHFAST